MRTNRRARRTGTWAIPAALLVIALGYPLQQAGCTQTSHLALTKALAHGTARIDRWHELTCDKAWFSSHYYSVKPPGLAVSALPAYLALDVTGRRPDDPQTESWLLNLVTVVPAALVLVWLTQKVADRLLPGSGLVSAVAMAVATLALPFGTLWFGHVPAAALGFAAFAVLLSAREGGRGLRADAAAGLLAGAAVLFEYPAAIVAVGLLLYAGATRGRWSAAAFAAGTAIPAAALLAYNRWAFGSFSHMSYEDAVIERGASGHDLVGANDAGFFGITWPHPHALAELLVSTRGLLTLTPVVALGVVGLVVSRRRAPAEAALSAGLVAAFLAYNAGYVLSFGGPFGGDTPGPRFLIAVLPFLAFPVGAAARAAPGAAAVLVAVSSGAMLLATATGPMLGEGENRVWLERLADGRFVDTVATRLGGGTGWLSILPFAAAVAAVALVGLRATLGEARLDKRMAVEAGGALGAWLLLLFASTHLFDHSGHVLGFTALALAGVVAGLTFVEARRGDHVGRRLFT